MYIYVFYINSKYTHTYIYICMYIYMCVPSRLIEAVSCGLDVLWLFGEFLPDSTGRDPHGGEK